MERKEFQGAYLGFTYNGIHSSTFDIVRTSDGSRYNQNLLPTIQDKSIQIPGKAGKVLQSSQYDTRVFTVQIAYEKMTEQQMQDFKKWLGDKKIHPLVFDEMPYKTWYAKVTGTASMKWLPFGETLTNRVYKGEGTIQFTCYDPFAHCKFDFDWTRYGNQEEWLDSSRLEERDIVLQGDLNNTLQYGSTNVCHIPVYNCGDMPADFIVKIDCKTMSFDDTVAISVKLTEDTAWTGPEVGYIRFDAVKALNNEIHISSKLNLIESYIAGANGVLKKQLGVPLAGGTTGAYFKIPAGKKYWLSVAFSGTSSGVEIKPEVTVDYEFLYL